jgi:asparagine synthetase B (glutamine-hydrolysing)
MPKFMYRNNYALGDNSKTLTSHLLVVYISSSMGSNSLEARVPFSDKAFAKFVMSIPAELKMNTTGHGKYLLRAAFDNGE